MSEKIIYEPHPVSPERVAELRSQGFTIIDAIYDPDRWTKKAPPAEPDAPWMEFAPSPPIEPPAKRGPGRPRKDAA